MRRWSVALLSELVLCVALACPAMRAAQGQPPASTTRLIADNPVIADLAAVAPPKLTDWVTRLNRITQAPPQAPRTAGVRGDEDRTKAEAAQMEANPDFALAYDRNPSASLALLRSLNEFLRKAHLNEDTGAPR